MRRITISLTVLAAAVLVPQSALSHVERNSYWPNPAVDRSVKGGAGGKVPKARSLTSALKSRRGARLRVVCKRTSLRSAYSSIRSARRHGFKLRPTAPRRKISAKKAAGLRRLNRAFFKRCRYRHIQKAVNRSRNGDRVVVMPGLYTEAPSRAKPKDDPRCAQFREQSDKGAGAASYRYQVTCPNDQSLVLLAGRRVNGAGPQPPRENRHGIPDEGACVRCNVQIEGSGARPDDVRLDGAKDPRRANLRKLGEQVKDVGLKGDRADGLVIRNMTFAHAKEHGVYIHETDGYRLDDVKFFYNGEYGSLTFASDHGLTSDCEATGHGDSGVYPGSAVNTGEDRQEARPRFNQAITRCDVYHNTLGYSGTMGNATHVYNNNFFDNSTGVTTDSFFAGGHPGYPQDSALFENNRIYSNNFNSFAKDSDVIPKIPVPVGTGLLIAGGNNNEVRNNKVWDNWRRGVMLMSVPDQASGQNESANSTSHRNRFHDNVMGAAAEGSGLPNGVDFWWDGAPGNADNCWYSNGSVSSDPPPPLLPSDCKNVSSGAIYPSRAPELGGCAASIEFGDETRAGSGSNPKFDEKQCPWFQTPPKPGSSSGSNGAPLSLPKADIAAFERVVRDMCAMTGSSTAPCEAAHSR